MRPAEGDPELPPGPARDLVDLFRHFRAAKPLSNTQLANRTKKSRGHVSDVLNGRTAPSPDFAEAITIAFGQDERTVRRARRLAEALAELNRYRRRQAPAPLTAASTSPNPEIWQAPVSGLPRADRCFTGREEELGLLTAALTGGAVVVLHGMPGAGKTALAVQAAARAREMFPDGVVFLDLHGYTAGHSPLDAATALERVLRRCGRRDVPEAAEERSAVLGDLFTGRRVLLVLDDAHDAAQVELLLPRSGGCTVLITSRRRMAALDDAHRIALGLMGDDEAGALFRAVAGGGAEAGSAALAEVIERCGHLPLAVRIAAARFRARPGRPLAELASRMSRSQELLAELDDEDRSVAVAFEVSFSDLPDSLRHTILMLAVHPGTELTDRPAAALLHTSPADAGRRLEQLAGRSLLIEVGGERYRFHDLIARYTRQRATELPDQERAAALRALVDYYLRATAQAGRWIAPQRRSAVLEVGTQDAELPALQHYRDATDWLAAEQSNLVDVCLAAGRSGLDVTCWQLANLLRDHFFLAKDWASWRLTHTEALAAARRARDPRAEALMHNNIGVAAIEQGHLGEATRHYEEARRLYATAGDDLGQNTAEANLAWVAFDRGDYQGFVARTEPVLASYRRAGYERNAAITLRGLGLAYGRMGRTTEALAALDAALADFERLELPLDLSMTLNGLGESRLSGGDPTSAAEAFHRALIAARECGSPFEQARALRGLGRVARAGGDAAGARDRWEESLVLFRRLGSPQVEELEEQISTLPDREEERP